MRTGSTTGVGGADREERSASPCSGPTGARFRVPVNSKLRKNSFFKGHRIGFPLVRAAVEQKFAGLLAQRLASRRSIRWRNTAAQSRLSYDKVPSLRLRWVLTNVRTGPAPNMSASPVWRAFCPTTVGGEAGVLLATPCAPVVRSFPWQSGGVPQISTLVPSSTTRCDGIRK
jgi:hypothetical protein